MEMATWAALALLRRYMDTRAQNTHPLSALRKPASGTGGQGVTGHSALHSLSAQLRATPRWPEDNEGRWRRLSQ